MDTSDRKQGRRDNSRMTSHELTCECGHSFASEKQKDYCNKCGRKAFLDPAERRKDKINNFYIGTLIVAVLAFIAFIFVEVIAIPILKF
jgi:hypothetical protein